MSKKAATVGDIGTDHDGFPPTPIITGSPDIIIDNKAAARVDDQLAPRSKPGSAPHPRTISSGSTTVFFNGKPAAVTGSDVDCGGVIIGGSSVIIGDLGPSESPTMRMHSAPTSASAEQTDQAFNEAASFTELFAENSSIDNWRPVLGYRGVIYHTKNNMDDYEADDLKHGDYTAAEILSLGQIYNFALNAQELAYPASVHFLELRAASTLVSSLGEYGSVITDLIAHFEINSGEKYSSALLTKAMKEHRTTKLFHAEIDKGIKLLLTQFNKMPLIARDLITQRINSTVSLPKFDDRRDRFNGLGMAVHDIFAAKVELIELEFKERQYRGKLSYRIQDHFGLDELDVNGGKGFEFFSAFRSWFLLQRYEGYNYKPFITEMVFELPIEGVF